jgi:hypothetical protein
VVTNKCSTEPGRFSHCRSTTPSKAEMSIPNAHFCRMTLVDARSPRPLVFAPVLSYFLRQRFLDWSIFRVSWLRPRISPTS